MNPPIIALFSALTGVARLATADTCWLHANDPRVAEVHYCRGGADPFHPCRVSLTGISIPLILAFSEPRLAGWPETRWTSTTRPVHAIRRCHPGARLALLVAEVMRRHFIDSSRVDGENMGSDRLKPIADD